MQAAQRRAFCVETEICLGDRWFQSMLGKLACTKHTSEVPAIVFSTVKVNQICARKLDL